ncbi:hydroxymethylpyrimidine/phosphomethylpyrimidine kinase [Clostridia bacterium]|nr:hydroxymethylpyrimidine/phosphomethylpyrimidine kinase [Clostridia bacterium]
MSDIKLALTIAGSDASGGAGIEADLKTFEEYGVYGMAAITVIVTMNPENWTHNVTLIDSDVIRAQIATATAGRKLSVLKTGMLANVEMIQIAADTIDNNGIQKVVIDPVMVCKGENAVLNPENADALKNILVPKSTVTTPNLFEAGVLSGLGKITDLDGIKEAAKRIHATGAKNVVVKGGKALAGNAAIDVFFDGTNIDVLETEKITHSFNHGAGCTFAAAVAGGLANGLSPRDSVYNAKEFVSSAIAHGFEFNRFVGPVFHGAIHALV